MTDDTDYSLESRCTGRIPGYQGYCPQFKYNYGKTFGRQTYELSQEQHQQEEPDTQVDYNSLWKYRKSLGEKRLQMAPAATMGSQTARRSNSCASERCNSLPPLGTGDSTRYSRSMIPGYTGYVPRWPFKYGCTYKNECDVCLDEFEAIQHINEYDRKCSLVYPRSAPNVRSVVSNPCVYNYLSELQATPNVKMLVSEPPIPGYKGFIPHVTTSEVGLGSRFYNMAREGYEALNSQHATAQQSRDQPSGIERSHQSAAHGNSSDSDQGTRQGINVRKDYSWLQNPKQKILHAL